MIIKLRAQTMQNNRTMRSLFAFMALLASVQAQPQLITPECGSPIYSEGSMANIRPDLELHWKVVQDEISMTLIYLDEAWVGIGFSEEGGMIGSAAILGLPDVYSRPTLYQLEGKVSYEVKQFPSQSLIHSDPERPVSQSEGVTQMEFSIPLFNEILLQEDGLSTMIYAVGETNDLGYHRHRGSFRIDWDHCDSVVNDPPEEEPEEPVTPADEVPFVPQPEPEPEPESEPEPEPEPERPAREPVYYESSHKAAFAAHGFFATVAFAIAIPFAISTAWFRELIPNRWIYFHVASNVLALMLAIGSVFIAFGSVALRNSGSHMSKGHHWTGVFLLLLLGFQVFNGFRRPPIESKVSENLYDIPQQPQRILCLKVPQTVRDVWKLMHLLTATSILILGACQISSGLSLFNAEYGSGSSGAIKVFWAYVCIMIVGLVCAKIFVVRRVGDARATQISQHADDMSVGADGEANEVESVYMNAINDVFKGIQVNVI